MWRPDIDTECLPPTLHLDFLGPSFFLNLELTNSARLDGWMGAAGILLFLPLHRCNWLSYVYAGAPNSGPHSYTLNTLPTVTEVSLSVD